ncbi:MAG: hydroxylamine reductase [Desulfovibrio sp.]|nr:hydroxylamine reductase [Desulfovibrio sp.]
MFCYQCQETAAGKGCMVKGVCGKTGEIADLQDVLLYVTKGLCSVTKALRSEGKTVAPEESYFITLNLFTTITNANFDAPNLEARIRETVSLRERLKASLGGSVALPDAARVNPKTREEMLELARGCGVLSCADEDKRSLRELITYGLKGLCAYMKHANVLGFRDEGLDAFVAETMASLLDDSLSVESLTKLALETGQKGVETMALLDTANTKTYGDPELTRVNTGVGKNPGILISGHDLKDLEMLLQACEGQGVDVYTHGEMLPAHAYPAFKKYTCLAGNYGNAWWMQKEEFERFRGPVLMTTNCVVPPKESYKGRLFTTGSVHVEGCTHIEENAEGKKDFSGLVSLAKTCQAPEELEKGSVVTGLAHTQIFALADKVVDAVKSGAIKHFVVMAGCDGRQKGRVYYKEFAEALPQDCVILTAGCAKYKYNKLPLGDIGGIPRVIDAGQCNDCYSLVLVALKLKEVFGLDDVNKLPIVYNIAWYEQKAVIVLLALLHLGVKNIHLGPTLPAFLSPNVADLLVKTFGIGSITSVDEDMRRFGLANA